MFHGSMVALVTPMREDGAVEDDSLEALVEFHIAEGTDAIVGMTFRIGMYGHMALVEVHDNTVW